jgi:hypothetical protein
VSSKDGTGVLLIDAGDQSFADAALKAFHGEP